MFVIAQTTVEVKWSVRYISCPIYGVRVMVFNATFNSISALSLLMKCIYNYYLSFTIGLFTWVHVKLNDTAIINCLNNFVLSDSLLSTTSYYVSPIIHAPYICSHSNFLQYISYKHTFCQKMVPNLFLSEFYEILTIKLRYTCSLFWQFLNIFMIHRFLEIMI